MMFGYDTRISMDEDWEDDINEYEAEEMDTIEGKIGNNKHWLADNENCHSAECDSDRAYHKRRIKELEDRRYQISQERIEREMKKQADEYD